MAGGRAALGIGRAFERFVADALQGVGKTLTVVAQIAVGFQHRIDHPDHFVGRKRWPYHFARLGCAAQGGTV